MGLFTKIEKQEVIGQLKASGSRDKDALYLLKMALLKRAEFGKLQGTILMVGGGFFTITLIGIALGIPMLIFGWWLKRRAISNVDVVESAYAEHIAGL